MRSVWILGSLVLFAAATPSAAGCDEWIASFADYETALEETLEAEPVWYLGAIRSAIELRREQSVSAVGELREEVAKHVTEFRALVPPPELATLHRLLSDYLDSVIAAVAAVEERDLPYDRLSTEELTFRLPTRRCYENLLAFYREMLRLVELHGCDEGDAEALRDRYIPRLEEVLESQFTGERGL